MILQIKTFEQTDRHELEKRVNQWIAYNSRENTRDVKYSTDIRYGVVYYSAVVLYYKNVEVDDSIPY